MNRDSAQRARNLLLAPIRRRLAADDGVTLVELIIAATVLVVVLLGVLASLDSAASTTAVNRGRTIAAGLAEQDQERMRGMRAVDLSNYHESRVVDVEGVKYTVESRSEWIRDATSTTETCNNDGKQADYMRITSTISTPGVIGKRVRPVELTSLVAPRVGNFGPNQGTLAVQVKDHLDKPVPGVHVNLSGPSTLTDVTNDEGCAVFGHIPTGAYNATLNQAGWVDPSGVQAATKAATVTSGTTKTVAFQYAQAASVTVSFDSKVNGTVKPAKSLALTAANPGIPTGVRVFTSATAQSSITASGLYPFTDGYTFYAGGCPSADPEDYVPNYFASNPGFLNVSPGGSASVTVRAPALNVQVTRALTQLGAPAYPDAYVIIRSTGAGCNDTFTFNKLNATGTLPDPPAMPFGEYRVCADDRNSRPVGSTNVRATTLTIKNDKPDGLPFTAGVPTQKVWINPNGTRSACA